MQHFPVLPFLTVNALAKDAGFRTSSFIAGDLTDETDPFHDHRLLDFLPDSEWFWRQPTFSLSTIQTTGTTPYST
jgi:hypothetical protein